VRAESYQACAAVLSHPVPPQLAVPIKGFPLEPLSTPSLHPVHVSEPLSPPLFCSCCGHRRHPSHYLPSSPCRSQSTTLHQGSFPSHQSFTFIAGVSLRCCRTGEPQPHRRPHLGVIIVKTFPLAGQPPLNARASVACAVCG
jgi:hypothetical protein